MHELEIINKLKQKIKNHPVVIQMFKDYDIDIDELDLFPICFSDLDVSAKTDHGIIFLNKSHLEHDPLDKDDHYLVHELTHVLQQTCGEKPTKGANDGDYLANKYEQEGFQNQSEYIADTRSPEKAEDYIDHVIDYHEVPEKDVEKRKDQLLSINNLKYYLVKTTKNKNILKLLAEDKDEFIKKAALKRLAFQTEKYFITPDGQDLKIPDDDLHDSVAFHILKKMDELPDVESCLDKYLRMGAIRIYGSDSMLYVEFKHLIKHNIKKIQEFIINHNLFNKYRYIRLTGFGDIITISLNDFMEGNLSSISRRKELDKVAERVASREVLKYFISPDGQTIDAPETHEKLAKEILPDSVDPIFDYIRMGAIRLSGYSNKLSVEMKYLNKYNINKIKDLIINNNLYNKINKITLQSYDNKLIEMFIDDFMNDDFKDVFRLDKAARRK